MAKKIVADGAKFSTVSTGKERNTLPLAPDMKTGDALSASVPKKRYRSKDTEDEILDDTSLVVAAAEQAAPDSVFAAAAEPPLLAQSDALTPGSEPDKTRQADASSSGNAGWWWLGAGVVAAGAGIGVGISGGGGGSNSGSTTTISGTVTDGPVQGARLYVDVDENGRYDKGTDTAVLDANGNQVVTDASGNFSFTVTGSGAGIKLVTQGGTDTVTEEAVTLDFSAPAGYNQINPITSAIAAYMEANPGITAAQAEIAVESALGLPDLDYSTVNLADPPAGLAAADILAAQQAVAILATAAIIIAQSGTDSDAFQYIAENLGASGSTTALVTAAQNANPSSAAQLADTVAAIEAATDLDTIGAALNNNFFADVVTTGILSVGQTVNGDIGLGNATGLDVAYQWQSSADGSSWTDIPGATGNSYLLTPGETGEHIRLEAAYTDTAGAAQTAYSSDMGVVPALNAAPELGNYTVTLAENSAKGAAVQTVTATEVDGDALSYSITAGNASGAFEINATTGAITVADVSKLNFETTPNFSLTVQASDGTSTDTGTIAVNLSNVNEAPVITSASTGSVAENAVTSTAVYIAAATDTDAGDSRAYSLSGTDAALFNVDAASGAVTLQSSADYETATSYAINVIATDAGGLIATQAITVNVTNLNDNPVDVINDGNIAANVVAEHAANGTEVGITAQATDADAGATIIYSLTDDAGGRFAINATSGIITIADGTLLDYESATSHDVTVLATSTDGSSNNQLLTINLTDINEAPLVTSGGTGTVAENADISTVVYSATASDVDSGQTIIYSLGGDDAALFSIDTATGEVTLNNSANYEDKASYNINVIATDDGTGALSSSQAVTINVTDVNDNPVFTSANTLSVAENSIDVMTIAATDEDLPALSVSYEIVGGVNMFDFFINPNTGELTFSNPPDFENPNGADFLSNTYEVEVRVHDSSGGSTIQAIAVTVTDVNEVPTITSDITGTVVENADINTVVYTVAANDPDPSDTLTYSLSGTDAADFNIDGTTGVVRLNASADYEAQNSYSINVVATDDGLGLMSSTQAVTISVANINELDISISAISDSDPGVNQVAYNAANGTAVGIVASATDSDPATTISYSLSDDAGGRFDIDVSSGIITLADNTLLDYAIATSHDVTVLATSSDGSTNSQLFTINVVDTTPPHLINSVFEDISGTGTLDAGDKLHLTFDEAISIDATGIYMAAFGSGATLAAVAPDGNGFSSEWDLTFGSGMTIAPNALNLSGAVSDISGNVNDNLAVPFHAPVQVVVDSSGAYIDANHDGLKDVGEMTSADFGFGGNADLGRLAVQVAFTEVPTTALDLTGFNHDDRIVINIDSLNMPGAGITTIQSNYFTNTSSGSITTMNVNLVSSPSERRAFVNDSMPHALRLYGIDNVSTATELLANFGTADLLANSRFIHQVAFVDNTGHVNVVVDANGDAYIDANDDGLLDAGDTVPADLVPSGTESLAHHSVDITFTAPVANPLSLQGFGADDRIHINLDSPGFGGFAGIGAQGISDVSYSSSWSSLKILGNSARLTVSMSTFDGYIYLRGSSMVGTFSTLANINSSLVDGMGGIIHHVDFVGNVALVPHELGTLAVQDVHVVVDDNGAWIDDNNDGRVNDSDTSADFTASGNADLSINAIDITVNGFPGILDLTGFNADDRIHINLNGSGIRALLSTAGVTTVDAGNIKLWVSASSQRSGLSALHLSATSWHTTQAISVSAGSSGLRFGVRFVASTIFATFGTENVVIDGSGNLMQQVDFVRLPLPPHVVVESDGNWLDLNANGMQDADDQVDGSYVVASFSSGGNADLVTNDVTIHFNDLPIVPIDLSGFDGNDRIEIDVAAMGNNISVPDSIGLASQATRTISSSQTIIYSGVSGVTSGNNAIFISSGNLKFGHRKTDLITPTSTVSNIYYTATGSLEGVLAINAGALANHFQQVVFVVPSGPE